MAFLFRLGLLNTLRNKRRTALTLLSIFFGVALYVTAQGFVDGIDRTLINNEIRTEHAHLRIVPANYLKDETYYPIDLPFEELDAVEEALHAAHPDVRTVRRTAFKAEIGDGRDTVSCRGLMVNTKAYGGILEVGDLTPPKEHELYAFVGFDLARTFDWKVGDRFAIRARTHSGSINAVDQVVIAGFLASGHMMVDNFTVIVPESVGHELLDVKAGFATGLLARFAHRDTADAAAAAVMSQWPLLEVQTWREKTRYLVELNDHRRNIFNFIIAIILLIGASSVANTALMSGFERTHEIGTLLALGVPRGRVVYLFLVEALAIAVVGTLLGTAVGGGFSWHFSIEGIPLPKIDVEEGSLPIPSVLYMHIAMKTVWRGIAIGLIVAMVASVYPAIRASRLDPVTALREG